MQMYILTCPNLSPSRSVPRSCFPPIRLFLSRAASSRGVLGAVETYLRCSQTAGGAALLISAARRKHPRNQASVRIWTLKITCHSVPSSLPPTALGKKYGHLIEREREREEKKSFFLRVGSNVVNI